MEQFVILNGQAIKKDEANISVYDKAMFFDFGVYDSLKVIQGKSFFPEFHADRLLESAAIIGLQHGFSKQDILDSFEMLIQKNSLKDSLIRVLLLGSGGENEKPRLFMFSMGLTFYPDHFYKKGIKVTTFHGERHFPKAKSTDLILNFIAFRDATEKEAKDALLIDHEGFIREGTRSNFFAVKDGKIFTAPLTDVLEGITRKIIVDLAGKNGIEIVEEKIKAEDLRQYDEFFISSTSMNVMPVVQIDDYVIEKGVGEVTKKMIQLFKEYYNKEVFKK